MKNILKIAIIALIYSNSFNASVANAHELERIECVCHQHEKQETDYTDLTDITQYDNYSFYRDEHGKFCAYRKNGWIFFKCRETPLTIEPNIKKYEPFVPKAKD